MSNNRSLRQKFTLIAGDVIVIVLVTVYGFSTHGTLGTAGLHILTTLIPLTLAWFAVAPLMGAYRADYVRNPARLWLPVWAALVAGPLASWFRALVLNAPILPLLPLILGGVTAAGMLVWRSLFYWFFVRRGPANG